MICSGCKSSIFEGGRTWGHHQLPSPKAEYCLLCGWQGEEARVWMGSNLQAALEKNHLYRWTIHRSPTFRESEVSCTIHFRPDVGRFPQLQNASMKKFHLIGAESVRVNLALDNKLGTESVGPQLDAWLDHCRAAHTGRCAVPESPPWVPKRLVDLSTLAEGRVVIRETKPLPGPRPRFVTLSHCWGGPGGPQMIRLLPGNRDVFTDPARGIQVGQLPRNFQDAVEIARLLEARYIWIDSLCILQDGEEFKTEGQLMHLVYRNSYCNLAAAASRHCEGGLFQERQRTAGFGGDIVETSEKSRFGKGRWRVFPAEYWSDQLLMEPLYRRGWVFQERMLSPRILHFAAGQVFWDCASTTACEVLPDGLPWQLDAASSTERYWRERLQLIEKKQGAAAAAPAPAAPQKFFGSADVSFETFWREAVGNYTACDLTQDTDRLLAVWGVAKLVRDQFRLGNGEEDYGVGLWCSQLAEQLAWRSRDPGKAARSPGLSRLWPSWSWASLVGPIDLQPRSSEPGQFYSATNHEGGAVCFELKAADAPRNGSDDVPRELQTKRLAVRGVFVGVAVLVGEEQRTTVITNEEPNINGGGGGGGGGGGEDAGRPEGGTYAYTLRLQHPADERTEMQSTGVFRAFPDSTSEFVQESNNVQCHLVILTASGNQDQDWGDDPWASEEEEEDQVPGAPAWIHGTGVLVVKADLSKDDDGKDHCQQYRRLGVCNFEGLSSDDFNRLEQSHISDLWLV
ncbi:HET-domain-containing protein [Apiospora saccharicola]|uniref:HET-domain-containing protein n=1 Tax=Apiospora saccharicola TaxID=335842 RepID=A0ABR1UK11_9PEZI